MTVTVTGVATTTTVTAAPSTIASTASTVLAIIVKAATGTAVPAGSIVLTAGTTNLGTATLVNGSASVTVKGSSLVPGTNLITASYSSNAGFVNSSGTVPVTMTVPPVATTTTLTASPASLATTGTSILTAVVKPSAAGSVTFALGNTTLGSSVLINGSATLILKGSSLSTGANVVTAAYAGASGFAASSGSATVVLVNSTPAKVLATAISKGVSTQLKGWLVALLLQEQAGTVASLTGFTINGIDYSSLITPAFGSAKLAANGALAANLVIQWSPLPATVTFGFSGVDAAGNKWTQTVPVSTK